MSQVRITLEVSIDVDDPKQVKALNAFLEALKTKEASTKKTPKKDGIKIEDVRSLVAKKVSAHRTDIKAELTRLEANNVTSLAEEKYQEFMDFLNNLK